MISEAILVLFLVHFRLITRDLFKRKLIKIAGPSVLRRTITTQVLDEIDRQIARYMFVQWMMSLLPFGTMLMGLYLAGCPWSSRLWRDPS